MEEEKKKTNNWVIFLGVLVFLLLVTNINLQYNIIKSRNEIERVRTEFTVTNETCYLWVQKDGVGFASPTEYCGQLRMNCNANYHDLSCKWITSEAIDTEGNLLNNTLEGCECLGG